MVASDTLKELHIILKENTDKDINIKYYNNFYSWFTYINVLSPISVDNYFSNKIDLHSLKNLKVKQRNNKYKDINNVDTYKNELDKILNSEEFKDVLSLKVYTNISTPPMNVNS